MSKEHVLFITGRLAEFSLRQVLAELAPRAGFEYSIDEIADLTGISPNTVKDRLLRGRRA